MVVKVDKPFQMLIADDDAGFRASLCELFAGRESVCTLDVESGEAAIEVAETQRVDIVLLDMHMHVLTGIETLRVLKSMNDQLPCILITGSLSEDVQRDANEAAAYSVLGKPVRRDELVSTVSHALIETYLGGDGSHCEPLF